jgi:hypothetical protein
MEYALDQNSARAGDKTGGKFIDITGAYEGAFTRVEALVSKDKGTHGIGFTFKTADEKTTNFDVWTVKADGTKLSGFDAVQAIMTCLRVRNMKPEAMTVTKYDFDARQDKQVQINGFPALSNKPIGVFLQKELSFYDGKDREKMVLQGSFEFGTHLTANEILDKSTESKNYASKLAWLEANPVKDVRSKVQSSAQQAPKNDFSDFDDDLAF